MLLSKTSPGDLLARLAQQFKARPFSAPRALAHGDLQTLSAYFWPGRFRPKDTSPDEERLFEVAADARVLARCRWQSRPTQHPTVVIWHGIEGSSSSAYMLATADKAFAAGFNVLRVNVRNCGGTEHLTPTLYHGGLSADARAVIEQLINLDHLPQIFIVGFSLGGNIVLKLAGEYGARAPRQLRGVAAISPAVDLRASTDLLMSPRNFIYHKDFLYNLKRRLKVKDELFPGRYDLSALRRIRTIREFDNTYIAPGFGFADVDDYYQQASALPYLQHIRVPTLIIHAQDDPFVPFAPLREALLNESRPRRVSISTNPNILLLTPQRGGHVAFVSANTHGEDRFWAENRLIDFFRTVAD